jgi:hypothetical protein
LHKLADPNDLREYAYNFLGIYDPKGDRNYVSNADLLFCADFGGQRYKVRAIAHRQKRSQPCLRSNLSGYRDKSAIGKRFKGFAEFRRHRDVMPTFFTLKNLNLRLE